MKGNIIYLAYILYINVCEELYYVSYNQCILRVELGLIAIDCVSMKECIKTVSRKKNACVDLNFFIKEKK